jgi:hypothetical protein
VVELIRQFGQWLKQGFGWLVEVFVTISTWGITQVSRLLGTHLKFAPTEQVLVSILIALLVVALLVWLFAGLWYRIRIALDMVVNAVGILFMALVVVATTFGGLGVISYLVLWVMSNVNVVSR